MSITVESVRDGESLGCESRVASHLVGDRPGVVLRVSIGNGASLLCLECARDLFNALGFMITTKTGESVAQLVGLKKMPKPKAKR